MIHLALDDLPDWRAGPELRQFAYVHLAPSLDAMSRTYHQAMAGMLPDEPVLVVGQPTAIDPSRAPEGKHVLWVQVRMLPAEILGDAAGKDHAGSLGQGQGTLCRPRPRHHQATRPGFAGKSSTVRCSHQSTSNARTQIVGGDQVCGSHHLAQNFLFSPGTRFRRLEHAGQEFASHRCCDVAGRWDRSGFGLYARATARREIRSETLQGMKFLV